MSLSASAGGSGSKTTVPKGQVPMVLFVWGPGRILPVRVTALLINEKLYYVLLNPTHAEAQISLKVLTTDDLKAVKGTLGTVRERRLQLLPEVARSPGRGQPGELGRVDHRHVAGLNAGQGKKEGRCVFRKQSLREPRDLDGRPAWRCHGRRDRPAATRLPASDRLLSPPDVGSARPAGVPVPDRRDGVLEDLRVEQRDGSNTRSWIKEQVT